MPTVDTNTGARRRNRRVSALVHDGVLWTSTNSGDVGGVGYG